LSRSICSIFILTAAFAGAPCSYTMVRPEIRRSFDLIEKRGHRSIYRVNVQVVNGDSLPISAIYIPYDQVEWCWSRPLDEEYRSSFMDIRGSASAGTGLWKELIREEVWDAPSDRVWGADCELGGIGRGGMLDLVFFALVDETLTIERKPLRIGIGTCGEESFEAGEQYWSSASELLLKRLPGEGRLKEYRYAGCADTLVISGIERGEIEEVREGWCILKQNDSTIVLVRESGVGAAQFSISCGSGAGSTGLIRWEGRWEGASHGFVSGPGNAEYSRLRSVTVLREPAWSRLLRGLSVAFFFTILLALVFRVQKHRKR
jgi:hypothetical protein